MVNQQATIIDNHCMATGHFNSFYMSFPIPDSGSSDPSQQAILSMKIGFEQPGVPGFLTVSHVYMIRTVLVHTSQ